MTDDTRRAVVLGGDGVVARFPGILCVARCADHAPVRALLQICREVAGAEPGRTLARRLAMWLGGTDAPPDTLVFGTVADGGDAVAVFLSGPVDAQVGGVVLDGAPDAPAAWVDRLVPPDGRVRLALPGATDPGPHGALCDLRAGVVTGAGVHVVAAAAAPAAAPVPARPTNAQPTLTNPIPDPDGTGPIPSSAVSAPLGRLVFDDGTTFPVDVEYVVGRLPGSDERVRAGTLRPIVVEDRTGAVSRVHAEVRVVGRDVVLVDSGSRNGTFVAAPGDPVWTPVPPGRSLRLLPGARVRVGERTFVFETPG